MNTNSMPGEVNGEVPARLPGEISIEPLKPKRPSRTVQDIEALLAALQVAIATDLSLAKREILDRIAGLSDSVEIIAREMAKRLDDSDEGSRSNEAP